MDDNIIEFVEDSEEMASSGPISLPMNFIPVGIVEREGVQVYIKQDVYKKIEKFAKEEMSKEVGSILVGAFLEEKDRYTVVISDYIEAKYTDASASTLTFTHETWDYVYKEKDKKYSDRKIVGWQHTHPGYGIFLSNYDMFIQENFFNLPWQLAYVVDPIADTRGFFEWKNGKVSKLSGFYIYDEVGREIRIAEKPKPDIRSISVSTVILLVMLLVSVLLSVSFGIEKNSAEKRLAEAEKQIAILGNTANTKEDTLESGQIAFRVYEVQPGDYLEDICKKHNLDYTLNIQEIRQINGISNTNKIFAGQKLYLPIK